jgi:cellulose synthase/poly-beta-1,6-N-acetylglucosamine synthase-like glycosyltransferase
MVVGWLSSIYLVAVGGLALFGLLGLVTLGYYWRHRRESFPCPQVPDERLPRVTVQLPVYNERLVVRRLIDAVAELDYPADQLQIQVLDDSTDETTGLAAEAVAYYRNRGLDISLHHRDDRSGYKAGALQAALAHASGEFVAVFDADFQPLPDFLRRTVPYFLADDNLGMVQGRWGHLNAAACALTEAQRIAMDKHFAMEQTVRHRANLFPKFNGSGGLWRKSCMIAAGGWQADTLCEDLCLSTRAILSGWRFLFLNDVTAPAELPTTVTAYKNQQARWAKGSTQCLIKFGRAIIAAKQQSRVARLYAVLSMGGYVAHLMLLMLLLVQVPLIALDYRPPSVLLLFGVAGLAQPLLFLQGQRALYRDWWRQLRYFPSLLLIAIGLAAANSRAILGAALGRPHPFVRTPKGQPPGRSRSPGPADQGYRLPADWIIAVELLLALYALAGLGLCVAHGAAGQLPFMLACSLGFGYVGLASLREQR